MDYIKYEMSLDTLVHRVYSVYDNVEACYCKRKAVYCQGIKDLLPSLSNYSSLSHSVPRQNHYAMLMPVAPRAHNALYKEDTLLGSDIVSRITRSITDQHD